METKINGHTVDLSKAVPLTLGDWETLEKKKILTPDGSIEIKGAKMVLELVTFIAQKADDKVTPDDVRQLSLPDVRKISEWIQKQMTEEQEDKLPLST